MNHWNFPTHIVTQVSKANRLMGLIRRSYCYLNKSSFRYLFNSIVRPHLEYCVTVWYPLFKKDEILIENVLRRASKLVPGLKELSYRERLEEINIPSMKYRRVRGDMIIVYKILHGYDKSLQYLFEVNANAVTRGHNFKLKKHFSKNSKRQNYFSNRVVNDWNSLPHDIVYPCECNFTWKF